MKKNKKVKGLEAELDYCIQMIEKEHIAQHWRIREMEIKVELKKLKGKK